MFCCKINEQTELRLIDLQHSQELFKLFETNREYLRQWHPFVEAIRSVGDVEKLISGWRQLFASNRALYAGIWFNGKFCGIINHLTIDWVNRWTALSYWLDAGHQRQGIMTNCCQALIAQSFNTWKMNRVTIECAAENVRSRAIPERLGFKLEGITRGSEWLGDHFVDHAIYGLLISDDAAGRLIKPS